MLRDSSTRITNLHAFQEADGCFHFVCRGRSFTAASGSLAEGLRIKHLLEELELRVSLTLWVVNSAARTMMIKQGLQRAKHIEIKWLWSQEVIAARRAQLKAVSSRDNLADYWNQEVRRRSTSDAEFAIGTTKRQGFQEKSA